MTTTASPASRKPRYQRSSTRHRVLGSLTKTLVIIAASVYAGSTLAAEPVKLKRFADFQREVLSYEGTCLVYYHRDSCRHCRRVGPIVSKYATMEGAAKVVIIDNHYQAFPKRHRPAGAPYRAVYRDGELVDISYGSRQPIGLANTARWVAQYQ